MRNFRDRGAVGAKRATRAMQTSFVKMAAETKGFQIPASAHASSRIPGLNRQGFGFRVYGLGFRV